LQSLKELQHKLKYLPEGYWQKVYQAYEIAAEAHSNQVRHSGEPYITHPLEVACILADMHMDVQTIIGALLHDVIEDTPVTKEFLVGVFGQTVADLVDGVSKLTQIEFKNRAEAQAENFYKMILAMSRDIRVMIIKLTDRLHNMRTLESLSPEKRRRIAKETLEIYAPIANRLGMHLIASELQNLGFIALYPKRYRVLQTSVHQVLGDQKKVMQWVSDALKAALTEHPLNVQLIGREKNLYSIYKKMHTRPFKEVTDVYGFRILTQSIDDCYRVLGVVHGLYKPIPEKFKDYIAIPKANGYQSLHTTLFGPFGVPIEIQIRTQEMNEIAESGIAAHWIYKINGEVPDEQHIRAQKWVKNLLEMQEKTGNSVEFIENVKIDLFPDEVYIFTPKGRIMELPRGATVIDFAYMVHTDIGNYCVAAKVDRQLTSLATVLTSGQTVEVITSPGAHPSPEWLNFVVTARARSGIRHFLKTQRLKQSIALGKGLLQKSLERFSLNLKDIPPEVFHAVLQEIKMKSIDDFYEAIGLGNRAALMAAYQLANAFRGHGSPQEMILEDAGKPLLIQGTEGVVVHFASCCYPIPGDLIVGIMNTGQGLVIHRSQCKRVIRQRQQPEKYMAVSWAKSVEGEFTAALQVTGENMRGVLARLATAISTTEANIDDISVIERDLHHYRIVFKLQVHHRKHLARVIRNLRGVQSVVKVLRRVNQLGK
jgi:guanosine-3',5'-bis(diphosphate) 3'-pyrophosphohydrolase